MNYFDYMATRSQPAMTQSDVIDWDPAVGIEVIEERLPRDVCVRRLTDNGEGE